ncbi:hypothetical protein ES707_08407 [subsurface metagenome]
MNKKILIAIMTIGLVAMLAGTGIYALFSDTETSTGNTFTAGKIDLTKSAETSISLTNMKPGDISPIGTITVTNAGTLPGSLYATSNYVKTGTMGADTFAKMLLITAFTADTVDITSQIPDVDADGRTTLYDMVNDGSGAVLGSYPASPGRLGTWYSYDTNMAPSMSLTPIL